MDLSAARDSLESAGAPWGAGVSLCRVPPRAADVRILVLDTGFYKAHEALSHLVVAGDSLFTDPVVAADLPDTAYTLLNAFPPGRLYWQVYASNNQGFATRSDAIFSFFDEPGEFLALTVVPDDTLVAAGDRLRYALTIENRTGEASIERRKAAV